MNIRPIEPNDFNAILELNENSVSMLSPLDRDALAKLLDSCALSVVVDISRQVAGFMLALEQGSDYQSLNYRWFDENFERFLYIDRIVVASEFRGRGIADSLYDFMIGWAERQSLPWILAEIEIQPRNEKSLRFHEKRGFVEIDRLAHGADKIVSLQQLALKPK